MSGHVRSLASSCNQDSLQRKRSSASSAPSTTVRSLRELQWSPSPASRGRMVRAIPFSQRDPRRSYVTGQLRIERISLPYPPLATCFCLPSNKKGRRNAGKRRSPTAASCDAARALLERARLTAFHHGSHLREYLIPKARLQARLPGTWSERALPAFACPSPGSTSHPGHHAGRLIPKPPESGLQIRPRAPHPPHLTACLR
jgi:hypothetical protein